MMRSAGKGPRTSPKRYSCRPHTPTAFMMDALWMIRTGMPACRARSSRSVCVVALRICAQLLYSSMRVRTVCHALFTCPMTCTSLQRDLCSSEDRSRRGLRTAQTKRMSQPLPRAPCWPGNELGIWAVTLMPKVSGLRKWSRLAHPPEGVADDEEGDVCGVGAPQDVLCCALHHLTVRHDHFLPIEGFLRPATGFSLLLDQCVVMPGLYCWYPPSNSGCTCWIGNHAYATVDAVQNVQSGLARSLTVCRCRNQVPSVLEQQDLHRRLCGVARLMAPAHQSLFGNEQDRRVRLQIHAFAPLDDLQAPACTNMACGWAAQQGFAAQACCCQAVALGLADARTCRTSR